MHSHFARPPLSALACVICAVVLVYQHNAAAQPASAPEDSTSEAGVRAAARAFATALGDGNAKDAKALCNGGAPEDSFIDAITSMVNGMRAFTDATVAAFGDAAKPTARHNPADKLLLDIDSSTIRVDDDRATLSKPGQTEPLRMIKVDGHWKIAALADPAQLRRTTPLFAAIGKAATQTAADVKAGKYDTLDTARDALDAHIHAAAQATTQPAAPGK